MEVSTILWPTDLSKNSIKAAKHVSSLAGKYGAKVILMYVALDIRNCLRAYGDPSEEQIKHFQEWEIKEAKKHLESVCEKELKACPNIEVKLVQGDAAAEILKTMEEAKADMVVLTSHGLGHEDIDQKSADFGSVAKKILSQSAVPVHMINPYAE